MALPSNLPPPQSSSSAVPVDKEKDSKTIESGKSKDIVKGALAKEPDKAKAPIKPGTIIVLTGIVAAGKSSIVKALQAIDPQFKEEDLDLRRDPKTPTTDDMERQMIDDTIDRSLNGEKTIISLYKADLLGKRLKERGITDVKFATVLAHCPFTEIPGRLESRNTAALAPKGNPENYRNPLTPIDQFAELYMGDLAGTEKIDRATAIQYFNTSFDRMIEYGRKLGDTFPPEEQIKKDKEDGLQDFLKAIGFKDSSQNEIYVKPKFDYNKVMDTSKYRDDESRQKFLRTLLTDIEK